MIRVDLNCDMGEGFDDGALFPYITSANIACGVHAGDEALMLRTLERASRYGIAAGAHPSLPDREHFGRREMDIAPDAARDVVAEQVASLVRLATGAGVRVTHVKPHGALYNMAAASPPLADAIAHAVRDVDSSLALFGLAGSALVAAGERAGLRTVAEVFADRGYDSDGSLVARGAPGAFITNEFAAAERALRMVTDGVVMAVSGVLVQVRAETICIHGDGVNAAATARALRAALVRGGVRVIAPGAP